MAMRSAKVSMERRRSGGGMNDNYPSVLPGHELTGLDGAPRPPAGEAVAHYSRFTEISSFPDHPGEAAPAETAEHLPMDALPERPRELVAGRKTSLLFSGMGSCLFHAVIVAVLLVTFVAAPEEAQEEAGDTVSVIMIGNSDTDQMAAGEEMPQTEPEQVMAEAVQPQTVQPTEVTPEETQPLRPDVVQPQEAETQQAQSAEPVAPVEQAQPTTVVPEQPQILATQAPAETTVIQPAEPVQPMEAEVAEAQPIEPPAAAVTPVEKPRPVEKPKEVKKPAAKVVKAKSGSRGEGREDTKRGSAEGTETAQADTNSQANARHTGSGDAAVANYKGKIQSRIRRYVQRVSSKYEKGLTLVVNLLIGSGGELRSLSLTRSSGDSALDQAVMEQIRNAAPFPPLPSEWGRPTWPFMQAVQVGGR
ncbi:MULTISPECIES: TonB family protein [unclassified Rhizobium]|uniref:cell envelope integrity protein TolA n=1 Tax=unclassified Rhizobium TaxID=2613769 RepID=UPI000EAACE1F|nr:MULTISPECIES: TonB family protein [unclassified Rhizobium]AYG67025.1 TonB family protein [Rhizobium sp. CCGE531]AYG73403.1 TonB family protein [Rhizobium sp. CCGE532]